MSTTQVHARRLSVVAVAACGLVGLSACSGGSSTDSATSAGTTASSTLATASSTSSASSTTTAASSSSSSGKSASSSSSAKSSASKSSSAKSSKSTKPTAKPDPVAACKTANTQSNQAISQWNSAVSSQSKSKLDAGARNFRTVAGSLRKLPAKAGNKGFTSRVNTVADDLDAMAKDRFAGKSVDPTKYNSDSETLRSYCQKVLTSQ